MPTALPVALVVALAAAPPALAGTGDLDPTFGSGGIVSTSIPGGTFGASAVMVQPDGRIVAAGSTELFGNASDVCLARYLPDGTLDPSFGTGGTVVNFTPFLLDGAADALLQPDAKIVVGGTTISRYDANGSLDPTFGSGGVAAVFGTAIALQPDGKIVASTFLVGDIQVTRLLADGTLDPAFGTGGVANSFTNGQGNAIAVQADGRIVVGGSVQGDAVLVRFMPDGSLDASFGVGGVARTDLGGSGDFVQAVAVQPDQRLVAAAETSVVTDGTSADVLVLARYETDGTPDAGFGDGGYVSTVVSPYLAAQDAMVDVVVDPDGRIVLAGLRAHYPATFAEAVLLRFLGDGTADPGFGNGGTVVLQPGTPGAFAGVALQNDGRIVAAGTVGDIVGDILVARFDGTCPTTPDTDGDGIGDACDPCTAGPAVARGRVVLRKQTPPAGDETLQIGGDVALPLAFVLDPLVTGLRVIIDDANGDRLIDTYVPPGLHDAAVGAGWTHSATGGVHRYANNGSTLRFPGGIRRVNLKRDTTGRIKVKIKGRDSDYTVQSAQLPLTATIVFTPPRGEGGECGEATFPGPPPTPACAFNGAGSAVKCR